MLSKIGHLVRLKDTEMSATFLGGLSEDGSDGKFTYCWSDNLTRVVFHVSTLMPIKLDTDPNCNNKFRHVGNDDVCIIYNDSGKRWFDKNVLTVNIRFFEFFKKVLIFKILPFWRRAEKRTTSRSVL